MKLTTLDYAILGLLFEEPRTGYAIRKVFEETAMGNYSSSPGSIYPSIKKLKAGQLIASSAQGKGELLTVQDSGRDALRGWLIESFNVEDVAKRSEILLLKFAFMDQLVTNDEKLTFMERFVDLTTTYLGQLKAYHQQESPRMALHGRLAIEHGIAAVETQLAWAQSTYEFFNTLNNTGK